MSLGAQMLRALCLPGEVCNLKMVTELAYDIPPKFWVQDLIAALVAACATKGRSTDSGFMLVQAATCPPGLGFQQAGGFAAAEAHGTEGSFGDGVPQVIRPFAGGGNTRVGDSSRVGAQSAGVGWDQPPADTVLQLQEEVDKMKQVRHLLSWLQNVFCADL